MPMKTHLKLLLDKVDSRSEQLYNTDMLSTRYLVWLWQGNIVMMGMAKWMKEGSEERLLIIALSCFFILLITRPESEVISK